MTNEKKIFYSERAVCMRNNRVVMITLLKSWEFLILKRFNTIAGRYLLPKRCWIVFLKFYHSQNCDDETIATWMLLYGPKADLEGEGCEFEIEDGFVAKGV